MWMNFCIACPLQDRRSTSFCFATIDGSRRRYRRILPEPRHALTLARVDSNHARMTHPSISTGRLVLTPYDMRDVDELHRVMSNPEVMRHIGKALSRAEVHDIVARVVVSWNETGMGWWTIRLSGGGHLIGQDFLGPDRGRWRRCGRLCLDNGYWRQGLASRSPEAVVDYGTSGESL